MSEAAGVGDSWAESFFDEVSRWWKKPAVAPRDHGRVALLQKLAGAPPLTVLEIGCGGGTTAVAMARAGYSVLGMDVSGIRIEQARVLDRQSRLTDGRSLRPEFLRADVYTVELGRTFDAVVYWNGFGVGTDDHQRLVLERIDREWLRAGGTLLLDVYSPWRWSAEHGRRTHVADMVREITFDPVGARFVENWWKLDDPERTLTQFGRCYAVADLLRLLSGLGLELVDVALTADESPDVTRVRPRAEEWFQMWSYTAIIRAKDAAR